ncbi:MAG: SCP2 sterol-binding domain-containing protein [Spongiibacteraceae bacterium]
MSSIDEIVSALTEKLAESKPFGKKIKFVLDGNNVFLDGTATPPTVSMADAAADATISASIEVFEKLMNKQMNPQMAFMSGKVKLQGDMMAAMALQKVFG